MKSKIRNLKSKIITIKRVPRRNEGRRSHEKTRKIYIKTRTCLRAVAKGYGRRRPAGRFHGFKRISRIENCKWSVASSE